MSADEATTPQLPNTPVGEQTAWFLRHDQTRGRDLTIDEIAEHMAFAPPWEPAVALQRFKESDVHTSEIARLKEASPYELEVTFDYGDDKPWTAVFGVEAEPPHRITRMFWSRAIAEDVNIREATAADSPALNDLEVRAPMTVATDTVTYDRGADFLGFTRLMDENVSLVADRNGQLLALACGAAHTVRIGGADYRVMLLHHLRVPVEHRKGGYFSALNSRVFGAYEGRTDGAYGYTAVDNAEAMRIGGPGAWSFGAFRAVLDCEGLAGPDHGRTATAADAERIVAVLNAGHKGEEMYLPYTAESFTTRMERAPELYSWDKVLIGDGAVVGVWPAGLRVAIVGPDGNTRSVRAVVLDHGFVPGAEAEFDRLVRAWCARLVQAGHSELTLATSEPSPSYPWVTPLASRMDAFLFRMSVPEPEGASTRGLYVDAVYF